MENPAALTGLGAMLRVNLDTRAFKYLLRDLGARGIEPILPEEAHITLIDSFETRFNVLSDRDQLALDRARDEAGRYLSGQRVERWTLTPEANEVVPFRNSRRKVGIILAEQIELTEIRNDLADIFKEEAAIRIHETRPYVAHLTLGSRTKDFRKLHKAFSAEERKRLKIPKVVLVTGFSIDERTYEAAEPDIVEGDSDRQRYKNVPGSVRRTM